MSQEEARSAVDASEEISALIEVLHRTGQRLEELTGGEVDAVADRDGRTFVLRQAQEHLRRIEAARRVAVLDALPASIALLDAQGVILSVNAAWRQFAGANAIPGSDAGIGLNYLEICDAAQGAGAAEARQVAAGIQSVLEGRAGSFSIEYPCHAPTEERWFVMTATPLADDPPHGVVVMHQDISERKRSEQALFESKEHFRFLNDLAEATRALAAPDQIMAVTARLLGQHLRASRCAYADVESDGQQFTIRHDYTDGCASTVGKYRLSHFGPLAVARLQSGQTLVIRDVDAELLPGEGADTFNAIGIKAIITCPLVKEGVLRAMMAVHQMTPRDWTPREVVIVQEVVERCWASIERSKAEIRIVQLNRVYAMLSGINTLIVHVHERDELFREACRIAVEVGGFRMVWIGGIDRNAMKIGLLASAGVDDEMLGTIKDSLALNKDLAFGSTMTTHAIRNKTAVVFNDSQNDARLVLPRQHGRAGIRSMAILPLLVADEAVGVFVLYASEVNFFQEEELTLIHELAGDIAFAMDHLDKQARLEYMAYYDELTGLANRSLFLERLAQYMRVARSQGHGLALFLVDLERFRNINDNLGRPAGDALLSQVAQWLTRLAGDASFVARIGSDVFAVVLPEIRPGGDVTRLIENSMGSFADHRFHFNDVEFRMALKVGVAVYPDDGGKVEMLVRNAEAALYHAKSGGLRYQFYTQAMTDLVAGRLTLENELRRALEHGEFVLHYQPKVSCGSGKITGFEALLRWQHPHRGLVAPLEFVPMLELTGLIVPVGDWVLRQACAQARRWHDAGLGVPSVAVNVSGRQLDVFDLCATVGSALAASGLPPACLELEFTEGQLMKDAEGVIDLLRRLKAMGVLLSVDDFGTGYSSLAYLKRFPLDSLKVDRAFVRDITADPNDVSITRAIITLAHNLKLKVVAEGVETEGQLGLLIANDCDEIQGYYFSRPLTVEEATELLRSGRMLDSRMMFGMKRSRTLLLVDDEPNVLSALKRLLRQDGYEILSALGGAQGLELLAGHPVDVIISDQRMPGMSGVDFLRRVKVLHPETVRMVLSGYTDLQSVTDAINEGAIYKFMTKPWVDGELRHTIGEAFRSKELAEQNRGLRPAITGSESGRVESLSACRAVSKMMT